MLPLMDYQWTPSKRLGRIYSWTETHHAFNPGFKGELPYILVTVDLDEESGLTRNFVMPISTNSKLVEKAGLISKWVMVTWCIPSSGCCEESSRRQRLPMTNGVPLN